MSFPPIFVVGVIGIFVVVAIATWASSHSWYHAKHVIKLTEEEAETRAILNDPETMAAIVEALSERASDER